MLVIIDVQERYIDEFQKQQKKFEKMITGLTERVRLARKHNEAVINLTHFEDGFTLPEVTKLVKSANPNFFLGKEEEDGSNSIHCLCQRQNLNPRKIELCGAFRDVCVLETWKGLKHLGYIVVPVKNELTIATTSNWRKIERYPKGYLESQRPRPEGQCFLLEDNMRFETEEENKKQLEQEINNELPKENEIIITAKGLVIIDEEGPIRAEDIGKPIGNPILCGC